MNVVFAEDDLESYLGSAVSISKDFPVVISKFISNAKVNVIIRSSKRYVQL